jgi:hypothetical protein
MDAMGASIGRKIHDGSIKNSLFANFCPGLRFSRQRKSGSPVQCTRPSMLDGMGPEVLVFSALGTWRRTLRLRPSRAISAAFLVFSQAFC